MFGRRDARAAAKWVRFAEHAACEGLTIVHIVDVYQLARNGTKAVITAYGDPQAHDAWFWWDRVETGTTSPSRSFRDTAHTRTAAVSSSSATRQPDPGCTTV